MGVHGDYPLLKASNGTEFYGFSEDYVIVPELDNMLLLGLGLAGLAGVRRKFKN